VKIVVIYNKRKAWGGEDLVVDTITGLLERSGHSVVSWTLDNDRIERNLRGKVGAFFGGIYSIAAKREMERLIEREKPDIVHAHNLFPGFSPSVLLACRRMGIPVVLHCHSYLLTCPITFHFREGAICTRCLGGREYWCLFLNCRDNLFESAGYALRNAIFTRLNLFRDNVTLFITLSAFTRNWMLNAGFPDHQLTILPNMLPCPGSAVDPAKGEYVAFSGRLSPEKGLDTLFAAADLVPEIPFRIAGDGPLFPELSARLPGNVILLGWLDQQQLPGFYGKARFLVVPSQWYEPFGMVAIEAMSHGLPVIVAAIGGPAEIVEDGKTGLHFEPGNPRDLANKIKRLWEDRELCTRMGNASGKKVTREYGEDVYYERLMGIYRQAISLQHARVN
jgi:glycosyltransferase involved in cell wall biosynthesis